MADIKDIYSSLKYKNNNYITKKDCIYAFIKNPTNFFNREDFLNLLLVCRNSPYKVCYKKTMRRALLADKVVQSIRRMFKYIFVDKPMVLFWIIIISINLLCEVILHKMILIAIIIIGFVFDFSIYIFYSIDNLICILSILKSELKGSSVYFAKSYLNLTKVKSSKFEFLYFEDSITNEYKQLYEEWVDELLNKIPALNDFSFNILIANEDSDIINESRKMIGIYDTPNQIVYENAYSNASLGLYSPAGATVICKDLPKDYFDDILNLFGDFEINKDIIHFSKDDIYFNKYRLYHEISHMITLDLDFTILENKKCISIFKKERYLLYPSKDDYFSHDIKEYMAESLARYLLEGRVGDLNIDIDFKSTDTYKMIEEYANRLFEL